MQQGTRRAEPPLRTGGAAPPRRRGPRARRSAVLRTPNPPGTSWLQEYWSGVRVSRRTTRDPVSIQHSVSPFMPSPTISSKKIRAAGRPRGARLGAHAAAAFREDVPRALPAARRQRPNFSVDPAKGFYKCFACGEAGDRLLLPHEAPGDELPGGGALRGRARGRGDAHEREERRPEDDPNRALPRRQRLRRRVVPAPALGGRGRPAGARRTWSGAASRRERPSASGWGGRRRRGRRWAMWRAGTASPTRCCSRSGW